MLGKQQEKTFEQARSDATIFGHRLSSIEVVGSGLYSAFCEFCGAVANIERKSKWRVSGRVYMEKCEAPAVRHLGRRTIHTTHNDGRSTTLAAREVEVFFYRTDEEASGMAIASKNQGLTETAHCYRSEKFNHPMGASYFAYIVHSPRFESEGKGFVNFHSLSGFRKHLA